MNSLIRLPAAQRLAQRLTLTHRRLALALENASLLLSGTRSIDNFDPASIERVKDGVPAPRGTSYALMRTEFTYSDTSSSRPGASSSAIQR